MKGLSTKGLSGADRERWAEARRRLYRGVLRDPSASNEAKALARKRIEATREPTGAR
jgi:hypothetical protein